MKSILITLFILTNLFSKTIDYTCIITREFNGELRAKKEAKLSLEKEWYGKPSALILYKDSGKIELILPNIQSKIDWFSKEISLFKVEDGNINVTVEFSKTSPYNIKGYGFANNKNIKINGKCIETKQNQGL
ncbi:hypothetical protein CRV03_01500 [Arcobacter sp. F155]|uniref:hypothetical protein n=1 Tax=Arcobacter sp. F155 TaxID=2044512 RepID=UPI00100B0FBC|nr:hypothetical protein [Arcobacter sp. F155]RXJ78731.1 hypothetical protein CRV03_01500 [Arcobacter sp. F155]